MKQIDYTKFRKGTKPNGRPIDYCPKCGRKGEKKTYKDKDEVVYVHKSHVQFGFNHIDEMCSIQNRRPQ